ncbi:MAG: hypothetical protein EBV51_06035, partial [Acidimicrobiia bacterium]|nr:hypothetical protein [Acidimicrobiia bacterium]
MSTAYDVRRADWLIVCAVAVYLIVTRANNKYCFAILFVATASFLGAIFCSQISRRTGLALLALLTFAAVNSRHAMNEYNDVQTGEYQGWVTIISDPQNIGAA